MGKNAKYLGKSQTNLLRTTSYEATYLIAGMLPADIFADDAKRLCEKQVWQTAWDQMNNGRWTYKLILNACGL